MLSFHTPTHGCMSNEEIKERGHGRNFQESHLMEMFPTIDSDEMPPAHTLMVEASMKKIRQPVLREIHDIIVARLGGNDIHSTTFASQGAEIDPVLCLFLGAYSCAPQTMT